MDEARFENPNVIIGGSVGFANCNTTMLSGFVSRSGTKSPPPSILDLFRAMVKQREDEIRVWEDEVVYLSTEEMVRLYELVLSELTFNSKPMIIDLTMIAREQRKHGRGIADAICAWILEAPDERKLPALYLLDSILKNIGREYVTYFPARLPQVFCETFRRVDSTVHPAMRRLFGTWSTLFPLSLLGKIEGCLRFSPSLNYESLSSLDSLRAVGTASPSHSGFDHGFKRVLGQSFETSPACKYNNGVNLDGTRALIDEREKSSDYKRQKVDHLKNAPLKIWQDTQEEEFNWEDMSPAFKRSEQVFADHPDVPSVTTKFRSKLSNQGQVSVFNEYHNPKEDISAISSGPGVLHRIAEFHDSCFTQESLSLPKTVPLSSQHPFSTKRVAGNHQLPFSAPLAEQKPPLIGSFQKADGRSWGYPAVSSSGFDPLPPVIQSAGPPLDIHNRPHSFPNPQTRENIAYQPATVTQGPSKSPFPLQQLGDIESKSQLNVPLFPTPKRGFIPLNHQFPSPKRGFIPLNHQFPSQVNLLRPQPRSSREAHRYIVPPSSVSASSDLNHGYIPPQGHGAPNSTVAMNNIRSVHSSVPVTNAPLQLPRALPAMPQGPFPVSSQMLPLSQNQGPIGPNPPSGGSLSGLLNTLMAQGVISLTHQASPRPHFASSEFNQDLLKVQQESAITALYADLPRQCTTCGLRFKSQEAQSSHMDWHVTKNRTSKSQKLKPSRNWFVNSSMWLSSSEALGADAIPEFLPTMNAMENNDDEEMAVPADDNQTACALCGEPFDDFYSDETEDWMYKGAVYMNAPNVSMPGIDRSQLGPIVHAKCRSETSGVSAEDRQKNERKRKRLPDTPPRAVKGKDSRVSIVTY